MEEDNSPPSCYSLAEVIIFESQDEESPLLSLPPTPPCPPKTISNLSDAAKSCLVEWVSIKIKGKISDQIFQEMLKSLKGIVYFVTFFLTLSDLAFKHETDFPLTWHQTLKLLYSLGLAGLETVWICDEPDHAHIFEKGESACPRCAKPKVECATQATVSIRETLSRELRSPITCAKLLDYLSSGMMLTKQFVVNSHRSLQPLSQNL